MSEQSPLKELSVQLSTENLECLLEHILSRERMVIGERGAAQTVIQIVKRMLHVTIVPTFASAAHGDVHAVVFCQDYECNSDGLRRAFGDVKAALLDLKTRGTCNDCASDERLTKRRRLLAAGMPKCCECMLAASIGL
jgi:hypothetical protein